MAETLSEIIDDLKAQILALRGVSPRIKSMVLSTVDALARDLQNRPQSGKRRPCHRCKREIPATYVIDTIYRPAHFFCPQCWFEAMDTGQFALMFNEMCIEANHRILEAEAEPDISEETWAKVAESHADRADALAKERGISEPAMPEEQKDAVSNEKVEEVLNKTNIVGVIQQYVRLTEVGATFKGTCPFHDDTEESLRVNPSKQLYYCFGCQSSGNAISFVMQKNNVSFQNAVNVLDHSLFF